MVRSTDVGSLPPNFDIRRFWSAADSYESLKSLLRPKDYGALHNEFERIVVETTKDKYKSGLDVPNYPQFRDMNEMFLHNINGVMKKDNGSFSITGPLSISAEKAKIAEVSAIEKNLDEIAGEAGGYVELKVCITGPYTLASQLNNKTNDTYAELGKVLSTITEANIFNKKHGRVSVLSIDEPAFGVDDPNIGYGGKGRQSLLKAWNDIAAEARPKGVQTVLHLHNTSDPLPWDSDVKIIESHVDDAIYSSVRTKHLLEERDKFLKAPIAVTLFDDLIRQRIVSNDPELTAAEWEKIRKHEADPASYLEDPAVMSKRLRKIVGFFGEERVPYAGPECGLGGYYVGNYPFYDCAIAYLGRIASVVRTYNASSKAG